MIVMIIITLIKMDHVNKCTIDILPKYCKDVNFEIDIINNQIF